MRLFGSCRQRTTDFTLRIGNQACMAKRSHVTFVAPRFPPRQHTPRTIAGPRFVRHCVPPACEDRDRFALPPKLGAARQRDYAGRMSLTAMERRCSALPPLSPSSYHHAWRSRSAEETVPPAAGYSLTLPLSTAREHVMLRRLASQPALDVSRAPASRSSNFRAPCVALRTMDNDGAFRHSATMRLPPGLPDRKPLTSALRKLPNL